MIDIKYNLIFSLFKIYKPIKQWKTSHCIFLGLTINNKIFYSKSRAIEPNQFKDTFKQLQLELLEEILL